MIFGRVPMPKPGFEPETSRIVGEHLTNCASLALMRKLDHFRFAIAALEGHPYMTS